MRLLFVAMAMLIAHTAVAQEKRNFRDIAFDYLLQNIKSISARPWKVKADHYDKMPNGDYLVKMTISRTLTRQEERLVNNQVQAYGSTFNVGVRNATVNVNYEDTKSFFVFVDRYGNPHKYMDASTNHEFNYWNGNAWLIMNKHTEKVGNKNLSYHSNAACFSNKGETKWLGRDMKIYGWSYVNNTLYMVGTLWDDGRSIVRAINTKTFASKDEVGTNGDIPFEISFADDGLRITQYTSDGQFSVFTSPYANEITDGASAQAINVGKVREDVGASLNPSISKSTNNTNVNSNLAWYVFGTQAELKEQKIIESNKLTPDSWNKNYFTKIDTRIDKRIKLYSTEASIMSSHPSDSYDLYKGDDGKYELKIKDPQSFWSHSKYLVILIK